MWNNSDYGWDTNRDKELKNKLITAEQLLGVVDLLAVYYTPCMSYIFTCIYIYCRACCIHVCEKSGAEVWKVPQREGQYIYIVLNRPIVKLRLLIRRPLYINVWLEPDINVQGACKPNINVQGACKPDINVKGASVPLKLF